MANIYKNKSIINRNEKILIILFVIFLFLIVSAIFSLAFFSTSRQSTGTITLGEVNFCVYDNFNYTQKVMPADIIPCEVKVKNSRNISGTNTNNLADFLLRFKMKLLVDNEIFDLDENLAQIVLANENLWTFDGNFYYYNFVLNVGQSVNICDYVSFSENVSNKFQDRQIDFSFEIDALQAQNDAYIEEWKDAPEEWKNIIANQLI